MWQCQLRPPKHSGPVGSLCSKLKTHRHREARLLEREFPPPTVVLQHRSIPCAQSEVARKLAEAIDSQPLPPDWLAQREVQDQLRLAITGLPAADQDVIFRFYFTGESYEQIAEALGITPRGVEGRLYRARGALRDKLAHLQDE